MTTKLTKMSTQAETQTPTPDPSQNSSFSMENLIEMLILLSSGVKDFISKLMQFVFFDHPGSAGEKYHQHLVRSMSLALRAQLAAMVLLVHSVFPCMFESTGSEIIIDLRNEATKLRLR